jgi:hypothetical protein
MDIVNIRLETDCINPHKAVIIVQGWAPMKDSVFASLRKLEASVRPSHGLPWELLWKDLGPADELTIETYGIQLPSCAALIAFEVVKTHENALVESCLADREKRGSEKGESQAAQNEPHQERVTTTVA